MNLLVSPTTAFAAGFANRVASRTLQLGSNLKQLATTGGTGWSGWAVIAWRGLFVFGFHHGFLRGVIADEILPSMKPLVNSLIQRRVVLYLCCKVKNWEIVCESCWSGSRYVGLACPDTPASFFQSAK